MSSARKSAKNARVKWTLPEEAFVEEDGGSLANLSGNGKWSLESRISMIALGVRDLPRSVKFYRDGLTFLPSSASNESIAFFKTGGVVLALYPWDKLAEDAQVPEEGHGFRGVTLAHNVRERKEVSEVLELFAKSNLL